MSDIKIEETRLHLHDCKLIDHSNDSNKAILNIEYAIGCTPQGKPNKPHNEPFQFNVNRLEFKKIVKEMLRYLDPDTFVLYESFLEKHLANSQS